MTTTTPIIYSVGTLVEVDNTKTGYMIAIDDTNDDIIRFKISYTVGNVLFWPCPLRTGEMDFLAKDCILDRVIGEYE